MPALIIFGLRLLQLAVYVEAVVIVLLLVLSAWLYSEAVRLFDLNEEARDVCADVRRTLRALERMKQIRRDTAERMARAEERSWP